MYDAIEEYICKHIDAEDPLLAELDRETHLYHLRPRMVSGHLQGSILKMFCRMVHPRRVLELGTFTGYSALCFAAGMDEDGEVHTIEIDDEIEDYVDKRNAVFLEATNARVQSLLKDHPDVLLGDSKKKKTEPEFSFNFHSKKQ